MSGTLSPSIVNVAGICTTIQATIKSDLGPELAASTIAPLLSVVNRWASQIPVMLEGTGPSNSANLVFAIRKDLFDSPQFTQCVLGVPVAELPAAFQEFMDFIHKLIEAQKAEKGPSRVRLLFVSRIVLLVLWCH